MAGPGSVFCATAPYIVQSSKMILHTQTSKTSKLNQLDRLLCQPAYDNLVVYLRIITVYHVLTVFTDNDTARAV